MFQKFGPSGPHGQNRNMKGESGNGNFKGGEKELLKKAYADGRNCIMLDRLMPGASIGRHTHETNSEIMYIVSGTATFTVGDTVETVQAGQCHYCPKGGTHMLQNRGGEPLVFFAVVTEQ